MNKLVIKRIVNCRSSLYQVQYQASRMSSNQTNQDSVLLQSFNDVCVIKLNRPEWRNAFDSKMINQLIDKLNQFSNSDQFKVGVLCGSEGNLSIGLDWRDFTQIDQLQSVNQLVF